MGKLDLMTLLTGLSFLVVNQVFGQDVWQLQTTGVDASLRGLCVVDSQVVWSSGTAGTVIRTDDGGVTWQDVSIAKAAELDFRDIEAFDENRAVVLSAGQPARVYRTTDSGKSWKMTFEHPDKDSFFDALSFWDDQNGIAMSDPVDGHVLLITTSDGGATWKQLPVNKRPRAEKGEAGFAASGTNMVVAGQRCLIALGGGETGQVEKESRIVYSDDFCESWKIAKVPMIRNSSSGIFSICFGDTKFGIAVGGNYQQPDIKTDNIAVSRDGGTSWQKPIGPAPRGYRSGIAFANQNGRRLAIAVGPGGTDLSADDGQNWKACSETGFHAIAFTKDGRHGWASGSDGRVAKWKGTK